MKRALWLCALLAACAPEPDLVIVPGEPPEDAVAAVAEPEPLFAPDFFSRLLGSGPDGSAEAEAQDELEPTPAAAAGPRRGLFEGLFGDGPEQEEPALVYGAFQRACGTPRRELGEEVARYPETGKGYRLFDTGPSRLDLRVHYITGFSDGCPRRFLAALALFGGPAVYETTLAKDAEDTLRGEAAQEYAALRRRICGAPVGDECSERRFNRLERDAVFVTVYERFGTNPTWADVLIYDGAVVAQDFSTVQ